MEHRKYIDRIDTGKTCRVGRLGLFLIPLLLLCLPWVAGAQDTAPVSQPPGLNISLQGIDGEGDLGIAIQIVILMTLLTLAPSILMLMTSFTRIVIVLGFVRNAIGVQSAPSNQIIIGIALFLTLFIMGPVVDHIQDDALQPYIRKEISSTDALEKASGHIKTFMLAQTRQTDIEFFLGLSRMGPTQVDALPLQILIPSFVLSELRTAFQMGFLIYLPFVMIDFLVATTLMSMGMMMMPPVIVSLPFKILLFVIVDGWYLVIRSLTQSFSL
ncbi:MAG: flagellar type III secretion system pore protein FliP [Opitutales bacterium]|nr:flagellar type III secretion system pore protein FliP [Opitutales bacterium]